jgi:HK97 family phage major capsid protein
MDGQIEIKELQTSFQNAMTEIKTLCQQQADEIKANGETSAATASKLEKMDGTVADISQSLTAVSERLSKAEAKANRPDQGGQTQQKTLGQMYVESEVFKSMGGANTINPGTVFQKALTDDPASAGALTDQFRRQQIFHDPNRPIRMRDLVNVVPVSESSVEVMRELLFDNQAGAQPGQLELKPESNITFELKNVPITTFAHWICASRQILADAPRLRAHIDMRMPYGLDLHNDFQILQGSGAGTDFLGLLNDPDIPDIGELDAGTDPDFVGAAMLDQLRRAITTCQTNEYYNITGVVLNPADWAAMETAKGTDGQYIWLQAPGAGGGPQVWRVPVVVANAMPQGSFILGDWSMGSTLYDRQQKSIRVAEQHEDFFVRNGIVILAEERLGFCTELPRAYCRGQFTIAVAP